MNWTFTNPWMLAGLAAVGLPVLVHYLTRARPRRVPFPPYRLLVEACAGQQSVHRLRTLLLLSLRCLLVLALVLLFARPFLRQGGAGAEGEASTRAVLILDASLSMRAVQGGVSLFARAQAEAAEVLRSLEGGSEAAVILAGATPRALLPALSRNVPALHEELVRSEATFERGDPAAALALARRMIEGGGTVYYFSDFQQSNWETLSELPGGLVYRLRPVTDGPVENAAITAVRLSPSEPVVGEAVEAVCTVFNGSPHPRRETVRLELGDVTQDQSVLAPPFSSADAVFNLTFARPGHYIGKASLPPDGLPEDNTRHIVLRVHKALQVLLVNDADASDRRNPGFFLDRALAPSEQAAPGLAVTRRHSQDVDRGILETADAFVIAAPAQLTGETIEIVARRVNEGAPLLVFLDGPDSPRLAPATFAPPFQVMDPVAAREGMSPVPGARAVFSDGDAVDWSSIRSYRYVRNRVLEGRSEDILLFYPDGSAALSLSRLGQGAVVFGNMPLTPEGGDLIGSPVFPALLHELLRASRGRGATSVMPGDSWTLNAVVTDDSPLVLNDPKGAPVEARVLSSGRITRLAMPPATAPGAYVAIQSGAIAGAAVVNIDPRESDPRPLALERLKESAGAATTVLRDESELRPAGETRPLWPFFAGAAALFLSLEMLLLAFWRTPRTMPTRIEGIGGRR